METHIYINTQTHTDIDTQTQTQTQTHTDIDTQTYTKTHIQRHTHRHTDTNCDIDIHTHTIYICMYIYIYMYIYIIIYHTVGNSPLMLPILKSTTTSRNRSSGILGPSEMSGSLVKSTGVSCSSAPSGGEVSVDEYVLKYMYSPG